MTLKPRLINTLIAIIASSIIVFPNAAHARDTTVQARNGQTEQTSPAPLSAVERSTVIDGVLKNLHDLYVFPEMGTKMEVAIREHARAGTYDTITDGGELAKKLTADLREISHDKHLRVLYRAKPAGTPTISPQDQAAQEQLEEKRDNWGFARVEILPGNIGYLDLHGFPSPASAGDKAAAVMTFLADTDALIIDLRNNGGGDPAMVALLCSYLVPAEPQAHLIDFYSRPDDSHTQSWTLPYVPGKRYVGKEVYLLTSHYTFSGAEEFSYDLQNLKRVTIIGETTGGGAHPGDVFPVEATLRAGHFAMFVPTGSPTSPITKNNWEGVGIKPDIAVSASAAQDTAYRTALTKLSTGATDPARRTVLEKILVTVKQGE